MEIIRYINGEKIDSNNMKNYVVESDIILQTIAQVNKRLKENFDKGHNRQKDVENF